MDTLVVNNHCQYFVVRKKRFCRMTLKNGQKYCGEHQPSSNEDELSDNMRISCPLDPSQLVK